MSTNIDNSVQIRPILHSSHPISLQIFFGVSDKEPPLERSSNIKEILKYWNHPHNFAIRNAVEIVDFIFRFFTSLQIIFVDDKKQL